MTDQPPTTATMPPDSSQGADWRHRSACQEHDPELFFPIGTSNSSLRQLDQAKAVCRRCPVINECLLWALDTGQDFGVWGGMSEEERRALNRRGGPRRARSTSGVYDVDMQQLITRREPIRDPRLARQVVAYLRDQPDRPNHNQIAAKLGVSRTWVERRIGEINKDWRRQTHAEGHNR